MKRGKGDCQFLREYYRFDCYHQVYRRAAKQLNSRPANAEALEGAEGNC